MTSVVGMLGFSDELQKIAARKGLKLIRQLFAKGTPETLAKAERLAITPGVLKKTQAGSQVKHLGSGMEGVSTMTAHPKRGLEVRKVIDPSGISGKGMVHSREQAGKALQHSSDVAQFRGARTTPGGLREQRFAYAPGAGAQTMPTKRVAMGTGAMANPTRRAAAQMKRLKLQGAQKGFGIQDLHADNMMTGPGGSKAVDFIAVPSAKTPANFANQANLARARRAQEMADKGIKSSYQAYLESPRRPGKVMARAYGKAAPQRMQRSVRREIAPRSVPAQSTTMSTAIKSPKAMRAARPAQATMPRMQMEF